MTVFQLSEKLVFPPVHLANHDGILAIGGDLSPARILLAYQNGIFPWFTDEEPIVWWSPDPRSIILPHQVKVSKSMRQLIRKKCFKVTYNESFSDVINACAKPREGQSEHGAWLTENMISAYISLNAMGYAHSVEVWEGKKLIGGLYGIAIGGVFFGESMFSLKSNASKYGLIQMCRDLELAGYQMVDCQIHSEHLESMGAILISRHQFISQLEENLNLRSNFLFSPRLTTAEF